MRLLHDKREIQQEREFRKQQEEEERLSEHCTFRPQISDLSQRLALIKQDSSETSVENRLLRQGEELRKKKQQLLEQKEREEYEKILEDREREEMESQAYLRKVKYGYLQEDQAPLHERYVEVQKERHERLEQRKKELESEMAGYFRPQISKNSELINKINRKEDEQDVVCRLQNEARRLKEKRVEHLNQKEREIYRDCRFQPDTHLTEKENRDILNHLRLYSVEVDFETRQSLMKQFYDQKRTILQSRGDANCTFKPEINEISQVIVGTRRTGEKKPVSEKLYEETRVLRERREELENHHYGQFKHTPELNPQSREIMYGKRRSLDSLAYDWETKQKIEILRENQKAEELRECSFYPKIDLSELHENVEPRYLDQPKKPPTISHQAQQELKNCTFKPQTNNPKKLKSHRSQLHKVGGIDSFLMRVDKK